MKKVLVILLLSLTTLFAGGIKWEKDYESALKQSKKLNKPMMFIISNHNCRFCVQLETTTLKNPKVVQKINAEYISAIVYIDESTNFPKDLYVGGTPATWFLKSDGEPLFQPLMGAVDPENYLKALEIVTEEYQKTARVK